MREDEDQQAAIGRINTAIRACLDKLDDVC
jgi:hypothetical protein